MRKNVHQATEITPKTQEAGVTGELPQTAQVVAKATKSESATVALDDQALRTSSDVNVEYLKAEDERIKAEHERLLDYDHRLWLELVSLYPEDDESLGAVTARHNARITRRQRGLVRGCTPPEFAKVETERRIKIGRLIARIKRNVSKITLNVALLKRNRDTIDGVLDDSQPQHGRLQTLRSSAKTSDPADSQSEVGNPE